MARELSSIEPLLPVIRQRPLGVFSDIDGTISPVVSRQEDATVPEGVRASLRGLVAKGVKVALVTGRSLEMAQRMVGLDDVAYAAAHGLTLWLDGRRETAPGLEEYEALIREAEQGLRALPEAVQGVSFESKGPVLAIHYRRAEDTEGAREAVLAALGRVEAVRRFHVQKGRMLVELRPPVALDKGTAVETLAGRFGVKGLICLGDDITDIDMFAATRRLQSQGLAGATVAVVSEEAVPEAAEAADYVLKGVEGVERLLAEMVRALP